jgi:hypothetical protein
MELVAFMAGEPWSDHPACTHPLLAELARAVNDTVSDEARPRLATLVPSAIGLTSDDRRWDLEIALITAAAALPVVLPYRRGPLAVGVLTCERLLASSGHTGDRPRGGARRVLARFPIAAEWAEAFVARTGSARASDDPARAVVSYAARAVAESGRPDTDEVLEDLLSGAVRVCQELRGTPMARRLEPEDWLQVCVPVAATA